MCGRYSLFVDPDELEERFESTFDYRFERSYNMAPSQLLPVITNEAPETITRFEWGLIPSWAESDSDRQINARAETIAEKPTFREAYERRRCLVLADGFYEWVETEDGTRPYRVAFEDDRPFAMAGIWERWQPETTQTGLDAFAGDGSDEENAAESTVREAFSVVTTEPNDLLDDLHHRMAAILAPEEEDEWLGRKSTDGNDRLDPHPAEEMRAYPVSTAVNDPSANDPSLVEPVGSG